MPDFHPTPQIPTRVAARLALRKGAADLADLCRPLYDLLPGFRDAEERQRGLMLLVGAEDAAKRLRDWAAKHAGEAWGEMHEGHASRED